MLYNNVSQNRTWVYAEWELRQPIMQHGGRIWANVCVLGMQLLWPCT